MKIKLRTASLPPLPQGEVGFDAKRQIRVRGYGPSIERSPSPGSHLTMRSDPRSSRGQALSPAGRGEGAAVDRHAGIPIQGQRAELFGAGSVMAPTGDGDCPLPTKKPGPISSSTRSRAGPIQPSR